VAIHSTTVPAKVPRVTVVEAVTVPTVGWAFQLTVVSPQAAVARRRS